MKAFAKILKLSGIAIVAIGILSPILGSFGFVLVIKGNKLPMLDWTSGIITAAIGAVLFFIALLMEKKYGVFDETDLSLKSDGPKLDMNDLSFIEKSIKKTRRMSFWGGLFMALFGIAMLIIPTQVDESTGIKVGLGIFGGICLLVGLLMLYQYTKLINIHSSEIYQLIMHTPQLITGLDVQVVNNGYTKVGQAIRVNIKVGKKSKGNLAITENDLILLRQYLRKYNPNLEEGAIAESTIH